MSLRFALGGRVPQFRIPRSAFRIPLSSCRPCHTPPSNPTGTQRTSFPRQMEPPQRMRTEEEKCTRLDPQTVCKRVFRPRTDSWYPQHRQSCWWHDDSTRLPALPLALVHDETRVFRLVTKGGDKEMAVG